MELTRRQFIINSSITAIAISLPASYISANTEIKNRFNDLKNFTHKQVKELYRYLLASLIPSIISMLFLAYSLELFSLFSSLLIIIMSIVILF
jgi:hypothetical protein